jgi:hypothetical protein
LLKNSLIKRLDRMYQNLDIHQHSCYDHAIKLLNVEIIVELIMSLNEQYRNGIVHPPNPSACPKLEGLIFNTIVKHHAQQLLEL